MLFGLEPLTADSLCQYFITLNVAVFRAKISENLQRLSVSGKMSSLLGWNKPWTPRPDNRHWYGEYYKLTVGFLVTFTTDFCSICTTYSYLKLPLDTHLMSFPGVKLG